MRNLFLSSLLLVSCSYGQQVDVVRPTPTPGPDPRQIELPDPPALTVEGHNLILSFEGCDQHPAWPGGASGITIGWGYDLGYYSLKVIAHDWVAIEMAQRARLLGVAGYTGTRALGRLGQVRDIYIARSLATDVFDHVDVAREFGNAKMAMPGFEDLRPNAQAALISLGFNRGWSFNGPNRTEMRDIRDTGVPRLDYPFIAGRLRKMVRVWVGTEIYNGMRRRRLAEAELVEKP